MVGDVDRMHPASESVVRPSATASAMPLRALEAFISTGPFVEGIDAATGRELGAAWPPLMVCRSSVSYLPIVRPLSAFARGDNHDDKDDDSDDGDDGCRLGRSVRPGLACPVLACGAPLLENTVRKSGQVVPLRIADTVVAWTSQVRPTSRADRSPMASLSRTLRSRATSPPTSTIGMFGHPADIVSGSGRGFLGITTDYAGTPVRTALTQWMSARPSDAGSIQRQSEEGFPTVEHAIDNFNPHTMRERWPTEALLQQ